METEGIGVKLRSPGPTDRVRHGRSSRHHREMKTTQAKIQSYFYCRLVGCMSKETEQPKREGEKERQREQCKSGRESEREVAWLVVNQFSFARSFSRLFLEAFFLIATRTNDDDDDVGEGDGEGDDKGPNDGRTTAITVTGRRRLK